MSSGVKLTKDDNRYDSVLSRTDIMMDLGESLNPAIDIGQVEGGFMQVSNLLQASECSFSCSLLTNQGYGLFVMEQLLHSPEGSLLTRGPGAYKIPSFNDVPAKFNVCLLRLYLIIIFVVLGGHWAAFLSLTIMTTVVNELLSGGLQTQEQCTPARQLGSLLSSLRRPSSGPSR